MKVSSLAESILALFMYYNIELPHNILMSLLSTPLSMRVINILLSLTRSSIDSILCSAADKKGLMYVHIRVFGFSEPV